MNAYALNSLGSGEIIAYAFESSGGRVYVLWLREDASERTQTTMDAFRSEYVCDSDRLLNIPVTDVPAGVRQQLQNAITADMLSVRAVADEFGWLSQLAA